VTVKKDNSSSLRVERKGFMHTSSTEKKGSNLALHQLGQHIHLPVALCQL
jgi:hypothetical protein